MCSHGLLRRRYCARRSASTVCPLGSTKILFDCSDPGATGDDFANSLCMVSASLWSFNLMFFLHPQIRRCRLYTLVLDSEINICSYRAGDDPLQVLLRCSKIVFCVHDFHDLVKSLAFLQVKVCYDALVECPASIRLPASLRLGGRPGTVSHGYMMHGGGCDGGVARYAC